MDKQYYWAENLEGYESDNDLSYKNNSDLNPVIEVKRLNFFIGKNNSGKSRFLRSLFTSNVFFISDNPPIDFNSVKKAVKEALDVAHNVERQIKSIRSQFEQKTHNIFKDSEEIENFQQKLEKFQMALKENLGAINNFFITDKSSLFILYNQYRIKNFYSDFKEYIEKFLDKCAEVNPDYIKLGEKYLNTRDDLIKEINDIESFFTSVCDANIELKKYIPVLRGMRPFENQNIINHYQNRTISDYFQKENDLYKKNNEYYGNKIITGENLYQELKEQQRELIAQYQRLLSQYFFENKEITLIPKHNDVVYIKIGDEPLRPIYQLGDGLQQVIILTYSAFLNKRNKNIFKNVFQNKNMFFIEEPELYMHAGMLRQLMNFYLNETDHYYFFTTHSNHLLDMADESDEVIIQKFVKETNDKGENQFKIYRCDRDRELLQSLGVKPSSVYLANCTIWVEGITDRLYLVKYMEKYLKNLKLISDFRKSNPDKNISIEDLTNEIKELMKLYGKQTYEELLTYLDDKKISYENFRQFMPNYHYAFIEYSGDNIEHWYFNNQGNDFNEENLTDKKISEIENIIFKKQLNADVVTTDRIVIVDGDIYSNKKRERLKDLQAQLENRLIILSKKEVIDTEEDVLKEIENTLPSDIIVKSAKAIFCRMRRDTENFDINKLNQNLDEAYFQSHEKGIGRLLDEKMEIPSGTLFAKGQGVGTIDDKRVFCVEVLKQLEQNDNWQLTESARILCEKIYQHIEQCNSIDSKESHIA